MNKISKNYLFLILTTLLSTFSLSAKENVVVAKEEDNKISENKIQETDEKLTIVSEGNYPDIKYGVKNSKDELIVPFKYDDIRDFKEGLARVGLNGKYGFINETGKIVIPIQYENASPYFEEGFVAVYSKVGGKYGFINTKGALITPIIYNEEAEVGDGNTWPGYFSNGYARVVKDGMFGIINPKGKEVVPCRYTDMYRSDDYGSLAIFPVMKGDKLGYVNISGKEIIPCIIDADGAALFKGNNAVAWKNRMVGVINKKGNWIISPEYNAIHLLDDGRIEAIREGYFSDKIIYYKNDGKPEKPIRSHEGFGALGILTLIFSGLIPITAIVSEFVGKHKKLTGGRILISLWSIIMGACLVVFVALGIINDELFNRDFAFLLPIAILICGIVWALQQDYKGTKIARLVINILGSIVFCILLALIILFDVTFF